MARATYVKKSRRRYSENETGIAGGIKKGTSYYWWKFRHGDKRFSLTAPRASQLTQSSFYSTLYNIQEVIECLTEDDDLPMAIEQAASDLRELAEECESNKSNMPDSLQESETGQLLEERAEFCNNAADELEAIDTEIEETDDEDKYDTLRDDLLQEIQGVDLSGI